MPRSSGAGFRFLLKGVEYAYDLLKLNRIDRSICVAAAIFHNLLDARSAKSPQGLSVKVFLPELRTFQREPDMPLRRIGKAHQVFFAASYPYNLFWRLAE